jgi:hypothetical protein
MKCNAIAQKDGRTVFDRPFRIEGTRIRSPQSLVRSLESDSTPLRSTENCLPRPDIIPVI